MMKAKSMGLISKEDVKLFDKKWWDRLDFILNFVEHQVTVELLSKLHNQFTAAIAASSSGRIDVEKAWESAMDIYFSIASLLFPWEERYREESKDKFSKIKKEASKLSESWQKVWGDIKSIKTRRAVANTVKEMMIGYYSKKYPGKAGEEKSRKLIEELDAWIYNSDNGISGLK